MVNVDINFEVQDKMGSLIASFWKSIKMESAPTPGIAFTDSDFVFEPNRTIQYDIGTHIYFVRHVEYTASPTEFIEMFSKMSGWVQK